MQELEVIAADSAEAHAILKDFRQYKGQERFVVELMGEGRIPSTVEGTPATNSRKVLVRYRNWQDWKEARPNIIYRWLKAARLAYLSVSLLPLFLALAASRSVWQSAGLLHFSLAILAVACLQISAQLGNDYEDHLRGIDSPANSGGSGVIQKLWIPAVHVKWAALFCLCLGIVTGSILLFLLPLAVAKHLLLIGLLGAFGAISYSGWPWHYKYLGLGEFIVFFLAGPILSLAGGVLLSGEPNYFLWYFLIGIPVGILACLRLHAGNMQKIPFDTLAKSRTLANLLPFSMAKKLLLWTMLLPYIAVSILMAAQILPPQTLLVFVTLPLVFSQWSMLRKVRSPMDPLLQDLRTTTAWQHLFFSLVYLASFLL